MPREFLNQTIRTVPLILILGGTVFACGFVADGSQRKVWYQSYNALVYYHILIVLAAIATLVLQQRRKWKGFLESAIAVGLVAVSPGWFAEQNAGNLGTCEPKFVFEMQVLFGLTLTCLLGQAIAWYRESNKWLI